MELTINQKPSNYLNELTKVKLKLANKKTFDFLICIGTCGFMFILIAALNFDFLGSFFFGGGTVISLLFAWYLYCLSKQKKKAFTKAQSYMAKNEQDIIITINDLLFTFRDAEAYYEIKWSMFMCFKVYKDYLFLMPHGNIQSSISIIKNEMLADDFEKLLVFLSGKMPQVK